MDFVIYDKSIIENKNLLNYIFSTFQENLGFLYGENMITEKSRQDWIKNNLLTDAYWRIVIAVDNDSKPCGFLIYTVSNGIFTVNDIEINKNYRFNPFILKGLFITAFTRENGNWKVLKGYINDKNAISKKNFLKLATEITKTDHGIILSIPREKITNQFLRRTI